MSLVIRQSRIHSYGCYTTQPLRKGTLVVEYVGERLSNNQAEDLYDDLPQTYLFGLDGGKQVLDGYGVAAFINHSCHPNCETDQIRGGIWIIALRDIQPGEELTYDYNLYDGEDDAPCFCGAPRCRGSLYSRRYLRKLERKRSRAKQQAAVSPRPGTLPATIDPLEHGIGTRRREFGQCDRSGAAPRSVQRESLAGLAGDLR